MEWINFNEQKPVGVSRVLVCDPYFGQVKILTYNDMCGCWDDEEGDDFYCDFSRIVWWMPLPEFQD